MDGKPWPIVTEVTVTFTLRWKEVRGGPSRRVLSVGGSGFLQSLAVFSRNFKLGLDEFLVVEFQSFGKGSDFLDFFKGGLATGIGDREEGFEKGHPFRPLGALEETSCQAKVVEPSGHARGGHLGHYLGCGL